MRYLFIISNEINQKELRKLEDTIASLNEDMRNSIELRYIKQPGQASDLAVEASEMSDENVTVVVCGGDNIIHEVVNGLAYRSTSLAVIPVGSENCFARTVTPEYIMLHPEKAIGILDQLRKIPVDLVRIDSYDILGNHLPVWSRYFLNVASFGFETRALTYSSEILEKNHKLTRKAAGIRGILHALKKVTTYKMDYNLEIVNSETNEICQDGEYLSISVCNGKYNNGCMMAPTAKIDDGVLDICVTEYPGKLKALKLFMLARFGKHVEDEHVKIFKATSGIISSKDNSFQLLGNTDGEMFYGNRVRFEVFPEALYFSYFPKEEQQKRS